MNRSEIDKALMQPRMLVAMMASGMITFVAIMSAITANGMAPPNPALRDVMLLILLALALGMAATYPLLRGQLIRQAQGRLQQAADGGLQRGASSTTGSAWAAAVPAFVTSTIIGTGMAEGLGLLGALTVLLTGAWVGLAAPALSMLAFAALFPTRERLRGFASAVAGRALEDPPAS